MRADARANRDRILEAAREALAADPRASMNSIGKEAGIGAGTLYRHFPSRDSLVLSVYRKELETVAGMASTLLGEQCPIRALRMWCERLAEFGRMKYGVADIVHAATSDLEMQATYETMLGAVRQLFEACKRSGDIRPGSDPEDFLVFLGLLWRIPPDAAGQARLARLLAIMLRGLGVEDMAEDVATRTAQRDASRTEPSHDGL